MIDDKLLKDIDKYILDLSDLQDWLNKVYYNEEFSGLFQKPVISMMMAGSDYLQENLKKLRVKYLSHFEDIESK